MKKENKKAFVHSWLLKQVKTKIKFRIFLHLIILFAFQQMVNATIINVPADQSTIQSGITASTNGDTVLVQPGTYYQNINFNGKNITVASLFLTTGDTTYISQTIINGNNSNSVVKFNSGETNDAVLSGFTITNGYAYYGAGINCYSGSSPTLSYLNIENNNGHPGDSYGGGLVCDGSSPTCSSLTFTGNYANEGGAVWVHSNGNASFSDCVFIDNTSSHGGAMQISYSDPVIDHSVFYENNSPYGGAVYVFNYSNPQFVNCTFSQNEADYGGAFYCSDLGGAPIITNCIFWDDQSLYNYEIWATSSTYPTVVTYSNVQDGSSQYWFGTGCIEDNPLFVDPENKNFHLGLGSPCIDTGDPNSPPDPDGSVADMGVFYYEEMELPGMASNPDPENNAIDIVLSQTLNWSNGENTETIDLYFGTENPLVDLVLENEPAIETYVPMELEPQTTYYWRVDCKNGDGTTTGTVWSFTTGINTSIDNVSDIDKVVEIFPNPANDKVFVRSGDKIKTFQLFNSYGNLVFSSDQNDFSISLDISDLAHGIYFVRGKTKAGDFSDKLIIKR